MRQGETLIYGKGKSQLFGKSWAVHLQKLEKIHHFAR